MTLSIAIIMHDTKHYCTLYCYSRCHLCWLSHIILFYWEPLSWVLWCRWRVSITRMMAAPFPGFEMTWLKKWDKSAATTSQCGCMGPRYVFATFMSWKITKLPIAQQPLKLEKKYGQILIHRYQETNKLFIVWNIPHSVFQLSTETRPAA